MFWIIELLCTTVGETAADGLNDTLGFGLVNTTYVTGACSWRISASPARRDPS